MEQKLRQATAALNPLHARQDACFDEKGECRIKLLACIGKIPLGPGRDELHQRRIIEAKQLMAAIEFDQQELVKPARDQAFHVEASPEGIIDRSAVESVQVIQIPMAEPDSVDVGGRSIGSRDAMEFDLVVKTDDL